MSQTSGCARSGAFQPSCSVVGRWRELWVPRKGRGSRRAKCSAHGSADFSPYPVRLCAPDDRFDSLSGGVLPLRPGTGR